jgi:LmbE family N-acetylglucosaminyl deacetylase
VKLASKAAWLLGLVLVIGRGSARAAPSAAEILDELRDFRVVGSVLHIAAHPDDENTQLIAYLARGRHYRTGYLSMTRGDGGQNLLGPEFDSQLGLIRTEELKAARHLDGGAQFFTRARDFGFSKDYQQTLTKWDRNQVLADTVRVIREFRPDVLITRFSPVPSRTHGHHTASAVIALEAFHLAGDPKAFPDQGLAPWQPRRIFVNAGGPNGAVNDIGGTDAVTGKSFGELAAMSRSMHKSQGFGSFSSSGRGGPHMESFQLLDGEPARGDILDGVDTTWGRVAGGSPIQALADQAEARFNPQDPSASLPLLLQIRSRLKGLASDPLVAEKSRLLDRIVADCIGLKVQTTVPSAEVTPGQSIPMHHVATLHSAVPVRWLAVRHVGAPVETNGASLGRGALELERDRPVASEETWTLPASTPVSQPYWLRRDGTAGMFEVDDPSLIGRPENPPVLELENVFEVGGQTLVLDDEPVRLTSGRPERLTVVAPVSLSFPAKVQLFAPSSTRVVEVNVHGVVDGTLALEAPAGWIVSPANQTFHASQTLAFRVSAPSHPEVASLCGRAEVEGRSYSNERIEINYEHIPKLLLQPAARVRAVCLDLAIKGRNIGYLPGAGDSVAASLSQMGYHVRMLTGPELSPDGLRGLSAVVVGVRAFNVRADLAEHVAGLFAWVHEGGTLVEQYNTPKGLLSERLAPWKLTLSSDLPANRVTDEKAAVTLLVPEHPVFNTPNMIVPADFEGWVQERGLNFPSEWDHQHLTELLACSDPGEAPLRSGLLVGKYGKGNFVYTGLSFFRQLPAGVPGAYRLFANLVSLGR